MHNLPSKELLSEVLDFKVESIEMKKGVDLDLDDLESDYLVALGVRQSGYGSIKVYDGVQTINIYELMHLMKEWAREEGFFILSANDGYCTVDNINDNYKPVYSFNRPTELRLLGNNKEFEAVTKACELILGNRNA